MNVTNAFIAALFARIVFADLRTPRYSAAVFLSAGSSSARMSWPASPGKGMGAISPLLRGSAFLDDQFVFGGVSGMTSYCEKEGAVSSASS